MNTILLMIAMLGQVPPDPTIHADSGMPWNTEAERKAWVRNMQFQRAYAESQARRSRIAQGRANGTAYSGYADYANFYQGNAYQQQWNMLQLLTRQQLYNNYNGQTYYVPPVPTPVYRYRY